MFGFALGIYVALRKIFVGAVPGWASSVASIWIVGGVYILSISIIGLYMVQVVLETKNRPRYVEESFQ